ncbi:hypothetical protein Ahy_B08g091693 [Arachis hypogaea]|uniref:Uncharacterized protein n=1 Tax=Arachis hypogaea TaxID=3818 RepID=A0A444Y2K8_ARAHY|nr:hypothetical protein Ahy_B08g091693 [Arachis hypogaea]
MEVIHHLKLDSDTIADTIRPLVEVDSSLKVRLVIEDVQSKFKYTISYRKVWLAKQKSIAKIFCGWKVFYECSPACCMKMCAQSQRSIVQGDQRQNNNTPSCTSEYGSSSMPNGVNTWLTLDTVSAVVVTSR